MNIFIAGIIGFVLGAAFTLLLQLVMWAMEEPERESDPPLPVRRDPPRPEME